MSFRGRDTSDLKAYLFYQGKELLQGRGGDSGAWIASVSVRTWYFSTVRQTVEPPVPYETRHALPENPGEYEIKVLRGGRLARSLKFTVDANGSFDNGIATANKLGSDRVIVPVKIIGDMDGAWDKLAWKTGAFYGNPLTGFEWPPPDK